MDTEPAGEFQQTIRATVDALMRGDKVVARNLAQLAISQQPESETPWLILASLSEPEESVKYLLKALELNPGSQQAQSALQAVLHPEDNLETDLSPDTEPLQPEAQAQTGPEPGADALLAVPFEPEDTQPLKIQPVPAGLDRLMNLLSGRRRWMVLSLAALAVLTAGFILLRPLLIGSPAVCDPSLVLNGRAFAVQLLRQRPDGAWDIPQGDLAHAYRLQGTQDRPVFVLAPAQENLDLVSAARDGGQATVVLENCAVTRYLLSAAAQETSPITVVIPPAADAAGQALYGAPVQEPSPSAGTPGFE